MLIYSYILSDEGKSTLVNYLREFLLVRKNIVYFGNMALELNRKFYVKKQKSMIIMN